MKNFKRMMCLLVVFSSLLVFVGCSNSQNPKEDKPVEVNEAGDVVEEDSNKQEEIKIAIVATGAGFGTQSFNDVALDGVKKASSVFNLEMIPIEVSEISDLPDSLRTLVAQGVNFIVLPDAETVDAAIEVSEEYPDVKFALLDTAVDGYESIASAQYREQEAAFLLGALGSMLSETKHIGFVGGVSGEIQDRFEYGYLAGAHFADSQVKVTTSYTGSFSDVGKGKEIATMMYGKGVDYIAPTTGAGNLGVFQAASEAGLKVFGAADGQFDKMPDNIVASQVKNIGNVIYNIIQETIEREFPGDESKEYGIVEGGVGLLYTPEEQLFETIPMEVLNRIVEIEEAIINGEISVPTNKEEFENFIK